MIRQPLKLVLEAVTSQTNEPTQTHCSPHSDEWGLHFVEDQGVHATFTGLVGLGKGPVFVTSRKASRALL
jgi:hypothetical protein